MHRRYSTLLNFRLLMTFFMALRLQNLLRALLIYLCYHFNHRSLWQLRNVRHISMWNALIFLGKKQQPNQKLTLLICTFFIFSLGGNFSLIKHLYLCGSCTTEKSKSNIKSNVKSKRSRLHNEFVA